MRAEIHARYSSDMQREASIEDQVEGLDRRSRHEWASAPFGKCRSADREQRHRLGDALQGVLPVILKAKV
jgi:hypothetical protein